MRSRMPKYWVKFSAARSVELRKSHHYVYMRAAYIWYAPRVSLGVYMYLMDILMCIWKGNVTERVYVSFWYITNMFLSVLVYIVNYLYLQSCVNIYFTLLVYIFIMSVYIFCKCTLNSLIVALAFMMCNKPEDSNRKWPRVIAFENACFSANVDMGSECVYMHSLLYT